MTAFEAQSQTNSLDSNELRTLLHIVNERNYYKSLDTISRAQISEMKESIGLYTISLETCERMVDNRDLVISSNIEELDLMENALRNESKRAKLFKAITKATLIAIPLAFVLGLVI